MTVADAEVVVVGAGHNGLICAAYLAKAGMDVLVLEARDSVGGWASTVDAIGARVNICNCDHSMVLTTPILEELGLHRFGLRYLDVDPGQLSVSWSGEPPWFLFRDPERTLASLGVSHPEEVANYQRYLRAALPVASLVRALTLSPLSRRSVLARAVEGRGDGVATLLRWSRRSIAEVVRSFFRAEALRGPVVTTGPAVWGLSPETPGTGLGVLKSRRSWTTQPHNEREAAPWPRARCDLSDLRPAPRPSQNSPAKSAGKRCPRTLAKASSGSQVLGQPWQRSRHRWSVEKRAA